MVKKLQKKYALSHQGAVDLIKGCIACAAQNISFMFPVSLLYILVSGFMGGNLGPAWVYAAGCALCIGLIFLTTWFQYNATYFATYRESGIRRITLAEKLRELPLSFFGERDLADLTSTIMADCTSLEQAFSHFVPEFAGSIASTVIVAIGLFFFDWRMALACLWVLPVSFAIVWLSAKVQESLSRKSMDGQDGLRRRDTGVHRVCARPEELQRGGRIPEGADGQDSRRGTPRGCKRARHGRVRRLSVADTEAGYSHLRAGRRQYFW